jgi:hypothetical protein
MGETRIKTDQYPTGEINSPIVGIISTTGEINSPIAEIVPTGLRPDEFQRTSSNLN